MDLIQEIYARYVRLVQDHPEASPEPQPGLPEARLGTRPSIAALIKKMQDIADEKARAQKDKDFTPKSISTEYVESLAQQILRETRAIYVDSEGKRRPKIVKGVVVTFPGTKEPVPLDIPLEIDAFMRYLQKISQDKTIPAACRAPTVTHNADPRKDVTFESIAGLQRAINDLKYTFIKPKTFPGLFPIRGGGMLLYGPPGTGKTLLAKATARDLTRTALFSIANAGELKGRYVGETERNIARLFDCVTQFLIENSKDYDDAIIFIDEFDSIAGQRNVPGGDPYMSNSVNALLQGMDGIQSNDKITIMAATNLPRKLDPAIISRLPNRIFADLPDYQARIVIIENSLVKAYYNESFHNDVPTNERITYVLKTMKEYGSYVDVEAGLTERLGVNEDNVGQANKKAYSISTDTIAFIAQLLGPQPPSDTMDKGDNRPGYKRLLERSRLGVEPSTGTVERQAYDAQKAIEFTNHGMFPFGFSGRDIGRVIERAALLAAIRALASSRALYKEVVSSGKAGPGTFMVYDAVATTRSVLKDNTFESKGFVSIDDLEKRVTRGQVNGKNLRNFCLKLSDVVQAIRDVPSTVNAAEYIETLKYAIDGQTE